MPTNCCASEFWLKKCGITHKTVDSFVLGKWQVYHRSPIYFIFRWVIFGLFVAANLISINEHFDVGGTWSNYFIYLTNWGINLCLVTTTFGAVLVTILYFQPELDLKPTPWVLKTYWSLHNVTVVLALTISILYWGLLYTPTSYVIDAANIATHLCNSVIMLIDFLVLAYPLRLYHVVMPMLLGISYTILTLLHHFADATNRDGKPYIYSTSDWTQPGTATVTSAGMIILLAVVHIGLFWVQHARVFLHQKLLQQPEDKVTTGKSNDIEMQKEENQ